MRPGDRADSSAGPITPVGIAANRVCRMLFVLIDASR